MQDHISLYLMYHHLYLQKQPFFLCIENGSRQHLYPRRGFWGCFEASTKWILAWMCVSPTVHFFRFFSNPFSPLRLNLLCLLAAQSSYFSLFFIEAWAIFGGREASVASSVSVLPSKSKARDFLARQACTHVKVPVARSSTKKNKATLL